MITNAQLREAFLPPEMEAYFREKLPTVPQSTLAAQIEECLKFLFIAEHCQGAIPVTQEIDDIWHLWILETKAYCQLCSSLGEGNYIHHSSNVYAQCAGESPPPNSLEADIGALGSYALNFGPFQETRVRYWRMASYLVTNGGMTLDALNTWLLAGLAAPA